MDKSLIKDQLGKLLIQLAINKIEDWSSQHLLKFRQNNHFPHCIEISKSQWVIGFFDIQKFNEHWWRISKDKKIIHDFYSRQAVFFYAVFESIQHYDLAKKLLLADRRCAKYFYEQQMFATKLLAKNVHKEKRLLLIMRLQNSRIEFESAREELNKSLKTAKYHKLWERLP